MRYFSCILLVSFLLAAVSASAKDEPSPAVNANTRASFESVSEWVRKQMDEGGRYAEVPPADRSKVLARLQRMDGLFQKKSDVNQMSDAEKTALFNDQEEINAILGNHDGDRLICKNDLPMGSHIPVRTCHTVRELAQQRRDSSEFLKRRAVPGARSESH